MTPSYCTIASGSAAGWYSCPCPSGTMRTGQAGYNCAYSGVWGCFATGSGGQFYVSGAADAYLWSYCLKAN